MHAAIVESQITYFGENIRGSSDDQLIALGVRPDHRRRGVGKDLVTEAMTGQGLVDRGLI